MAEVHLPRPGHADLAGSGSSVTDVRNVLERASARETAARVAGGALAKAFLRALGVEVRSHVLRIGSVRAPSSGALRPRTSRASTPRPSAASTRRRRRRWSRRSTAAQGQRVPGRLFEVLTFGAARARLARLLGGAPRRPPGPGDHVDPVPEGRGGGGGLRLAESAGLAAHDEIL